MPDPKSEASKGASNRDRLPFEPSKSRKSAESKVEKKAPASVKPAAKGKPGKPSNPTSKSSGIPEVVSRRMVRRMALLCGIPTVLGISTFFVSYFLVTQEIASLPNVAVVLVSMGFFGLGVLGLTYGVLSASWDEDSPGSAVGWTEFTTNFGRMRSAWRSPDKKS
jgi:Photosynthesis affected mutant 68